MSTNQNPLGGRGKAEEDRWAREQDREAIEKMKKAGGNDASGTGTAKGPCKDHPNTAKKDCCKKK